MRFLFSMCICCLFFSEDSAVFPPPYPPPPSLVCAILPWNRLGNQFFFPCIFLTISLLPTFLSGSKNFLLGGLVAPSFFISGILLPTVNNSPIKGELLRVTEPQNCYAGYPCFLNTFLRILQKLYAGFLHCYSPKAQF